MKKREISLSEISRIINLELTGKDCIIDGLNLCNKASIHDSVISYITSAKFLKSLTNNQKVRAVFLTKELYDAIHDKFNDLSFIITENPEEKFYDLHTYLYEFSDFYDHFNFESQVEKNCIIDKTACIENGIVIGNNTIIKQNAVIKRGTVIGNDSIIGCGSIIGSEGFQLISSSTGKNRLIKHAGGCRIGDRVYIGDNTTICNSLFEDTTVIGNDSKIDNLVHVAHNCVIGENCVLTAGVILSGSTIIGNNVWIAPNSSISNKVIMGNNSFIGIGSVVLKKVKEGSKIFGNPAKEI